MHSGYIFFFVFLSTERYFTKPEPPTFQILKRPILMGKTWNPTKTSDCIEKIYIDIHQFTTAGFHFTSNCNNVQFWNYCPKIHDNESHLSIVANVALYRLLWWLLIVFQFTNNKHCLLNLSHRWHFWGGLCADKQRTQLKNRQVGHTIALQSSVPSHMASVKCKFSPWNG